MFLADPVSGAADTFVQYGVLGAVALFLGVFAYRAWNREKDRADRLENQLAEANQRAIDLLVPALTQTRDALTAANDYLRDLARRDRP